MDQGLVNTDNVTILGDGTPGNPLRAISISGGAVRFAQLDISSAELLALAGAPLTIVPAPPLGEFIAILGASMQYKAGITPYTITAPTDVIGFIYAGSTIGAGGLLMGVSQTGFIDQAASRVAENVVILANFGNAHQAQLATEATGLQVSADNSPTLGDGTLRVLVQYALLPLA